METDHNQQQDASTSAIKKNQTTGRLPRALKSKLALDNATLEQLINLFKQGDLEGCKQLALSITSEHPKQGFSWKVLGTVYQNQGENEAACDALLKAAKLLPKDMDVQYNLANAYFDLSQHDLAIKHYKKAVKLQPDFIKAHYNLASIYFTTEQYKLAERHFKIVIALDETQVEAHLKLVQLYDDQKKYEAAIALLTKLIDQNISTPAIYQSLAVEYQRLDRKEDAIETYLSALAISPDSINLYDSFGQYLNEIKDYENAELYLLKGLELDQDASQLLNTIGLLYFHLKNYNEARYYFKRCMVKHPENPSAFINFGFMLLECGEPDKAQGFFLKALQLDPDNLIARNNLGLAYNNAGHSHEAIIEFEKVLDIDPDFVPALSNLSMPLKRVGRLTDAENYLKHALTIQTTHDLYVNLAAIYQGKGLFKESLEYNAKAIELNPDITMPYSNLLFGLSYTDDYDNDYLLSQLNRYGDTVTRLATFTFDAWQKRVDGSRLKVGFVSGDYYMHPVTSFLSTVLESIDKDKFELYAYANNVKEDYITQLIKPHFYSWKSLVSLSDEDAATLIHKDGIDVLIDLSGHSGANRLPMFAYKPAPVQATWLGYWASTGVSEIDYILLDEMSAPAEIHDQFTEQVHYVPDTRFCYSPPNDHMEVSPLPAMKNGYITFGCYHNYSKVSDEVLAVWAEVLLQSPTAVLRWQSVAFGDALIMQEVHDKFVAYGINQDRIILKGGTSRNDYLLTYNEVDFVLDAFPFTACTTSSDGLWMGVPTLALAGHSLVARQSTSLMNAVGLPDWIAKDKADYIAKAVTFAKDVEGLGLVRENLRPQMMASTLGNAEKFTRNIEKALVEIYEAKVGEVNFDEKIDHAQQGINLAVQVISATRHSEQAFWEKSALGQSIKPILETNHNLSINITFDNTEGLPAVFNRQIAQAEDDAILVFMHDDAWIDQPEFIQAVNKGLKQYDLIGVAGNKRRVVNQPNWAFVNTKFTWDSEDNLSGAIASGTAPFGSVHTYGVYPEACELLDGVFLAIKKSTLTAANITFDTRFDFHFYDMDFCRSVRAENLTIGTWHIALTHESGGDFHADDWTKAYETYLNKWEVDVDESEEVLAVAHQQSKEGEMQKEQSIEDAYQTALDLQLNGQDDEAEALYLAILSTDANHADASHNLGFIEFNKKSAAEALPRFKVAVEANPESEQFWVSYIDALMQSGEEQKTIDIWIKLGLKHGLTDESAQMLRKELDGGDNAINIDYFQQHRGHFDSNSAQSVDMPLLSICIPTFNRCAPLEEALASISNQAIFLNTNLVEIVIADNCSTDETQDMVEAFAAKYPGKVKYIRNEMNIGGALNFEMAMSHGTGQFLKLINDNVYINDGALIEILDVVKATTVEKPLIFLTNGHKSVEGHMAIANNLSEFVERVSYFSTWIGGFGIWRDDYHSMPDFSRMIDSQLTQTDVLCRMMTSGKKALVMTESYYGNVKTAVKKGGYNIAEVFGQNYLAILKPYLESGHLDRSVYEQEKKEVLFKHIIPYYFDASNGFKKSGFLQNTCKTTCKMITSMKPSKG